MVAEAGTNKVLGVSLVMRDAGEVIHEAAMGMRLGARIEDFIGLTRLSDHGRGSEDRRHLPLQRPRKAVMLCRVASASGATWPWRLVESVRESVWGPRVTTGALLPRHSSPEGDVIAPLCRPSNTWLY